VLSLWKLRCAAAELVLQQMLPWLQVRYVASDVIKETEALSLKTQAENTKRLAERLHDINFWKQELKREIEDMISETDLLCAQKRRLENALRATEIPLHIATDNLNCRQRRQGIDLVQDDVELNLLKVSCREPSDVEFLMCSAYSHCSNSIDSQLAVSQLPMLFTNDTLRRCASPEVLSSAVRNHNVISAVVFKCCN
jgi:hypothetical protein